MSRGGRAEIAFRFKIDKPATSFRCRLDKQVFQASRSPLKLKAKVGRHKMACSELHAQCD